MGWPEEIELIDPALAERFDVIGLLGAGGMGTVYEARDRVRNEIVALKTLRSSDAESRYRFKREFRALSDLSHPNLVVLYELLAGSEMWAFTMELIRGMSLQKWLRPSGPSGNVRVRRAEADETPTLTQRVSSGGGDAAPAPSRHGFTDEHRLRDMLRQLASGISALHLGGHVHRDVKPSNVMVADTGRVIVLDFGVIAELGRASEPDSIMVGTPAYMAPEQALPDSRPDSASDWYSFGVVLYELLTGRRPYLGSTTEVLLAKQEVDPPKIGDLVPDAPADLAQLCHELLARRPELRPSGAEIVARLAPEDSAQVRKRVSLRPARGVIGRERERDELEAHFASALEGRPRMMLVAGPSGMGKTTLVEGFLEGASEALVLRGRCYARESVPHKALDSLVDDLGRWLTEAPADLVLEVRPDDVGALIEVFPVLRRVPLFCGKTMEPSSRDEAKRRAFRALRQLIVSLSEKRPVVAFIDDLQWGDLDSFPLFTDLLGQARCRLLVVATCRSDEAGTSPLLVALRESARGSLRGVLHERVLEPIAGDDVRELARATLGPRADETLLDRIVAESNGSPYFAIELARHARASAGALHGMTLQSLLRARAAALDEGTRRVLEAVAVAGSALDRKVIERVCGLSPSSKPFIELASAHFLGNLEGDRVDTLHDAVREAVLADLPASAQRATHRAIAEALGSDPAAVYAVAQHWFHAFPDAPAETVFAACDSAARDAARAHAYDQAFVQLERARAVADAAGLTLDGEFHRRSGDAAARTGKVEAAITGLTAALSKATDSLARASLHLARAKIHLARLDTHASVDDVVSGLRELGESPLQDGPRELAAQLPKLVALQARIRLGTAPALSPRDVERLRLASLLWFQYGVAAYFRLDKAAQLKVMVRLGGAVMRLGPSSERVRWFAGVGMLLSLLGARAPAQRFDRASQATAELVGTDAARAVALLYRAHGINFEGDPVGAEAAMRSCLTKYGHVLENHDFHLLVSHLAGVLMTRGHARGGLRWVEIGLERATLVSGDGRARLDDRHTYAGPTSMMLALLGRVAEGRGHLDTFAALLERADDRWRRLHWLVHLVSFLVETGGSREELELAAARFAALKMSPRELPVQFRLVYASLAQARLDQLDGTSAARDRFLAARAELARAGSHPVLRTRLLRIDAAFAIHEGDRPRGVASLEAAHALADAIDDRLVLWDVHVLRARLATNAVAATHHLSRATALAEREGWLPRLRRTQG